MSYCVNCGVELDPSMKRCPLCNTPVWHPETEENKPEDKKTPPYPPEKGDVRFVKHTGIAVLITVFAGSTSVGCGLLNLFLFTEVRWSLFIIGACVMLWLLCIPLMTYQKVPMVLILFLDGVGIAIYCGIIAAYMRGWEWYLGLALPIIALGTLLLILLTILRHRVSSSILYNAINVALAIGVYCNGIDLIICHYMTGKLAISWSAIVMTCCLIMAASFLTIMRVTRLREELRRRMHL